MAIRIPIITDLQDQGIKQAKAAFSDFKTSVAKAEGGMNKFKAGSKAAMDGVKAQANNLAMIAGAAIAGFALKAIGQFQELALAAKKFSDATGLAVEDASRVMEVAGDIGIPVETLTTAIGKLNKTIGMDPDKVRDLGVDLVYLSNGALDVNETFLKTIERIKGIKDPAEKAKVATQLLGKGWQGMSELIAMGADDLRKSLASVDDSKIIDEDEVKKAEDYRAAMDTLRDSFEKMAINLGERLIPKVAQLLELLAKLPEALRGSGGVVEDVFSTKQMAAFGDKTAIARLEFERLSKIYIPYIESRTALNELSTAAAQVTREFEETNDAWLELKNSLELDSQMISARDGLDKLKETAIEAFNGSKEALAEYEQGLINAQLMVLKLAENVNMTNSQQNKIRVLVETGELEYAYELMDAIRTNGHIDLVKAAAAKALAAGRGLGIPGGTPGTEYDRPGMRNLNIPGLQFRANGGPVMSGGSYIVGERGPELFTPSSSGSITPNNAMGGANITVNVNGGDPNSIVRALQQYVRQSGPVPVNTRAM